jgi:hypothetical protein
MGLDIYFRGYVGGNKNKSKEMLQEFRNTTDLHMALTGDRGTLDSEELLDIIERLESKGDKLSAEDQKALPLLLKVLERMETDNIEEILYSCSY